MRVTSVLIRNPTVTVEDMSKNASFRESGAPGLTGNDGTYEVTLLTPGQGASAFYTEELVARDAPVAFPKGTHVYLDHLEEGERRTTQKLVGTLVEDTTIREHDGAAINRLKPFKHWAEFVEEVRESIALSISANGTSNESVVNGRKVKMAESLTYSPTNTVDIVPWGGRQGAGFNESLQAALEADIDDQPESSATGETHEGTKMELSAEAITAIASAVSQAVGDKLTEALKPAPVEKDENADRLATVAAVKAVESAEVPASVKARLTEGIANGSLDLDAITATIAETLVLREEIKVEVETKFNESRVIGAGGSAGAVVEATKVKGW